MARVVLVTGVSQYLGARLARLLERDPDVDRVVGVDVVPPQEDLGDVEFVRADIRNPVIAKVINAADTSLLDKDPLAAGFEAIAVGYGLRFPDDLENLERQFDVYDSLYAWCRPNVARKEL